MREEIEARCLANPEYAVRLGAFGFLELEEAWGDEVAIANTARISTSNQGIKDVSGFTGKDRAPLYLHPLTPAQASSAPLPAAKSH